MQERILGDISPNVKFKIASNEKTDVPDGAVLQYHADVKGKKICTWEVSDDEIRTFLLDPKTRVELLCHQAVIKKGRLDDLIYYVDELYEQWDLLLGLNGLSDTIDIYTKGLKPIGAFSEEEKLTFLNIHLEKEIQEGYWEWEYTLRRDKEFSEFLANLDDLSLLQKDELEVLRFVVEE